MGTDWTPERLVQEAQTLAEGGKAADARRLVSEALRLAPQSLPGWTLAAQLATNPKEEIYCLKQALQIDPSQTRASERLREIAVLQTGRVALSSAGSAVQDATTPQPLGAPPPDDDTPAATFSPPPEPATVTSVGKPRSGPLPKSLAPTPPPARSARRRGADPVLVFLCVMVLLFCGLFGLTVVALRSRLNTVTALPTSIPSLLTGTPAVPAPTDVPDDCAALITRALQVAESTCSRLGPNQVCYGNTQLLAKLAPGATQPFQARGDIIGVEQLLRISASPLDLATKDWGVAIFKLLANAPRTLPGQNVTFIVFGNTSLDNASSDLQAFYFSSQLGQVACARVPSDGILIHVPEGAGLTFTANGSAITLLGTGELRAHANQAMTVSVAGGSASVTALGQTQYFGAGQEVSVPLSGADGLEPAGPPSPPSDIAGGLPATCAVLGVACSPGDVKRIDPTEAARAIAQAMATSTASRTATLRRSPTPSARPRLSALTLTPPTARSATPWLVPTASVTPNPGAPTSTPPPSPTRTPVPTASVTPNPGTPTSTPPPSPTRTLVPTALPSPTASRTDTPVPPSTATPVPPNTPSCLQKAGSLAVSGASLTLSVQNSGAAPVTIASMMLDWPDTPPHQKIREIRLGGVVIDSSNYNNPPSSIPLSGVWIIGHPADRQLPAYAQKGLEFMFQWVLPPAGYNLTINFDNGCSVSASR